MIVMLVLKHRVIDCSSFSVQSHIALKMKLPALLLICDNVYKTFGPIACNNFS